MTGLLLDAALKSTIVLALAWLATVLLRRGSADVRHRIWLVALAGAVLVALPWPIPEPVIIDVGATFTATGTGTSATSGPVSWVPIIWSIGLALALIRFGVGVFRLEWITRSALASDVVGTLASDAVSGPMTWGAIRPVILLPAYAMEWAPEKLDVVLRHERAHVERRDWLWQSFAQVVTAVLWFHPLVWFAAERLRQEAEQATDDLVLASGSDATGYAEQLMDVARRIRGSIPHEAVAVTMVRPSALTSRVTAILDSSRTRVRAGVRARAMIGMAAVCLIAVLIACRHANAQVYRPGGGVTTPTIIYRVEPRYSEEARKAKWSGNVQVSLIVDAQGRPQHVRVVKGAGLGLDEMAIEAVQKWRFKPGQKNGKAVAVAAIIEVNFRLL